jgi:hypothetical protein
MDSITVSLAFRSTQFQVPFISFQSLGFLSSAIRHARELWDPTIKATKSPLEFPVSRNFHPVGGL